MFLAALVPCPTRPFGSNYFPLDLVPRYPLEEDFQCDGWLPMRMLAVHAGFVRTTPTPMYR